MKSYGICHLLLVFVILSTSCKSSKFQGMQATEQQDTLQVKKDLVIADGRQTDDPAQVDLSPPADKGDKVTIEVPSEEESKDSSKEDKVLIPIEKHKPEKNYLNLKVTKLKHDSLFKNCLYISINGLPFSEVTCNKDFNEDSKIKNYGPFDVEECVRVSFRMLSFKPTYEKQCIAKIQANRDNHSCVYNVNPFRDVRLGASTRFKTSRIDDERGTRQIKFEDHTDNDFNDFIFNMRFEAIGKYQLDQYDKCDY